MAPRWWVGLREGGRALLGRRAFEAELDEEIRFHLEEATERKVRGGMSPAEARRAARLDFGGVESAKEGVRSATGVRLLQDLVEDARHVVRAVRRQPTFALVVALTVAVCTGAAGAVSGVVHSVLLRPLPFPEADRLVSVYNGYPGAGRPRSGNSVPDFLDRRELVGSLEEVALYTRSTYVLGGAEGGRRTPALAVTPSFFGVLRVVPALGRVLREGADGSGGAREAVIGHDLWRAAFGGSPGAVGATAYLDGEPFTVVGVLPASFRFPAGEAQLFTPLAFTARESSDEARHADWYEMIGRLRPGATVEAARAEIAALNRARLAEYPPALRDEMVAAGFHTEVRPFLTDLTRDVRRPILLLWAGVALVLLIGSANVTSLFLVRGRSRSREVATRLALGAGRGRVLRQLATESTLLTLLGGAAGVLLARWSLRLVALLDVYRIPRLDDVSLDAVVVTAMLAAAVALGAAAGVAPTVALLRGSGAGPLRGHRDGEGAGSSRAHRTLVSAQIALAFVLVMGAGLLAASVRKLIDVDPGFDPGGVAVAAISLPDAGYPDEAARLGLARRLLGSLAGVPGVREVAIADQLPFTGATPRVATVSEADDPPGGDLAGAPFQTVVSPGYFAALGIGLVAGRGFLASDDATAPRVAVVDEAFARRHWPAGDGVGRRIWRGRPGDPRDPARALTVVGVVRPIRQNSLMEPEPAGAFYVPLAQVPLGSFRLAVRLDGDPAALWPVARARLAALDSTLVLASATTLGEQVDASLVLQRAPMRLLSLFSLVGLFLGAVGVYGVMAYLVGRREREIGIRMAVGSTPGQVAALVARECALVVGAGVALGLLGAAAATRAIADLLYATGPLDPAVVAGALGTILATTLLAALPPVRRAVRIDPATVLRDP